MSSRQGRRNRQRGAEFEREVVNAARAIGLAAERVQGRAGAARLGDPDVVIDGDITLECKRRKSLPGYLTEWCEGVDAAVIREDRGKALVVMSLEKWLKWLKWARETRTEGACECMDDAGGEDE